MAPETGPDAGLMHATCLRVPSTLAPTKIANFMREPRREDVIVGRGQDGEDDWPEL